MDRQHKGQKKKVKRTNNDLQNIHIKLKQEKLIHFMTSFSYLNLYKNTPCRAIVKVSSNYTKTRLCTSCSIYKFKGKLYDHIVQYTLENTDGAIKNGQSREIGNMNKSASQYFLLYFEVKIQCLIHDGLKGVIYANFRTFL